jgi:hypothetical protein
VTDIATIGFRANTRGLVDAEKGLDRVTAAGGRVDGSLNTVRNTVRLLGGALAAVGIVQFFRSVNDEVDTLQRNMLRTEALLRSTGRLVGDNNEALYQQARNLALATLESTEGIQRAQQILLTFKSVSIESFEEVTETALNLAAVTGTNVTSAMQQLGRALEDPIQGITALRRSGVSFTASQRDVIRSLVEAGDAAGAQRIILDELATQYGGVAKAEALGFAGAQDTLRQRMQEFKIVVNDALGISDRLTAFYNNAAEAAKRLTDVVASGEIAARVRGVVDAFSSGFDDILYGAGVSAAGVRYAFTHTFSEITGFVTDAASFIGDAFMNLPRNLRAIIQIMGVEFGFLVDYAKATGSGILEVFGGLYDALIGSAAAAGRAIANNLNPFSDSERVSVMDAMAEAFAAPMIEANNRVAASFEVIKSARRESIEWILAERDASIAASAAREAGYKNLTDEYRKQLEKRKALSASDPSSDPETIAEKATAAGKKIIEALQDELLQVQLSAEAYTRLQLAKEGVIGADADYAIGLMRTIEEQKKLNAELSTSQKLNNAFDGIADGIGKMQGAMEQGSEEAKAMGVAMQALAVVQGIVAIVTQGMGDPYTAFARMAAMAAAVAGLGIQTGSIGGGSSQSASEQRQATQGTGGVLGDATKQSESILKATELTANATDQLVGISRAQLDALRAMQSGIESAIGRLVRGGTGEFDFGNQNITPSNIMDTVVGGISSVLPSLTADFMIKALGARATVVDEGIQILGATMGEMMDDVLVRGFQEMETRSSIFSSTRLREGFGEFDTALGRQIGLIFSSMADSVQAGAEALGFAGDDVREAIMAFNVAEQMISLKDLDPEEQQAQLNAVFSSIFDGLAGSVVPFIDRFQRVGEGLGETLARVATNVQVTEEAIFRLGFSAERLGAEQFAELSTSLVELSGGLDEFISGMLGFVDKFASDATKFTLAQSDITRALDSVGLAVPPTRDAMWDLMQSLDAATESGREQIATLLRAQDAADAYYSILESAERERANLSIQLLEAQGDAEGALAATRALALDGLHESNRAMQQQIWALNDLAEAEKRLAKDREGVAEALSGETDRALLMLRSSLDNSISIARNQYESAGAKLEAEFNRRVESAENWLQTQLDFFDRAIKRTGDSISSLSALASGIASAVDANRIASTSVIVASRSSAQESLANALRLARSGGEVGDLSGVLSALGQTDSQGFSTQREFEADMNRTALSLIELGTLTNDQLSIEQKTLESLQGRRDDARSNHTRIIDQLKQDAEKQENRLSAIYDSQVSNLNAIYNAAQSQIDGLRGIDNSVLDVEGAVENLEHAMMAEFANESHALQNENNALIQQLIDEIKELKRQQHEDSRAIANFAEISAQEARRQRYINEEDAA